MPELPEVEALKWFLRSKAQGRSLQRAELGSLSALKTYDPPWEILVGGEIAAVERLGKYLCLKVGEVWLVAHLARAGWLHWRDRLAAKRLGAGRSPVACRFSFVEGDGFDITEQGTEKKLALWVVSHPRDVEGVARLGVDPLSSGFDVETLGEILRGARGQIKSTLTDQSLIAGVGNAYSDEALHGARLSPFKLASQLTDQELLRLHGALVGVLEAAVARSRDLGASELKADKKASMAVHAKTGLPCPVCADTVREVSLSSKSFQYCPTCQTGGKVLADRRLSRLLK